MCGRLERINYASTIKYVSYMLDGKGRNHAQHKKTMISTKEDWKIDNNDRVA